MEETLTSLLLGARDDVRDLLHDYAALGRVEARGRLRLMGLIAVSCILGMIGGVQLLYGILALSMADMSLLLDHARVVTTSGVIWLAIAAVIYTVAKVRLHRASTHHL